MKTALTRLATAGAIALVFLTSVSACMDTGNFIEPIDDVDTGPTSAASAADTDCGLVICPEGPRPGGGGSTFVANNVGLTIEQCQAGTDSDGDGLTDACELTVARAFAPWMRVHPSDDITRDEYYAVTPSTGNRILVFYAFGYHRDHGRVCSHAICTAHNGDSEFVIVEVAAQSDPTWYMTEVFLSAHLGEGWGADHSDRFDATELDSYRGAPIVWVAKNKHANYKSKAACEGGGLGWGIAEHCGSNELAFFRVYADGNLGQSENDNPGAGLRMLTNCVGSRSRPNLPRTECYWIAGRRFYGWQSRREDNGSGAYYDKLAQFGFHRTRAPRLAVSWP